MTYAVDCDAGQEACQNTAAPERPNGDDFNSLFFTFVGAVYLLATPLLPLLFVDNSNASGNEFVIYFLPSFVYTYAYSIPFVLFLIYLVFGANLFLFRWVDTALVLIIEHWISNAMIVVVTSTLWLSLMVSVTSVEVFNWYHLLATIFQMVF